MIPPTHPIFKPPSRRWVSPPIILMSGAFHGRDNRQWGGSVFSHQTTLSAVVNKLMYCGAGQSVLPSREVKPAGANGE